MLEDDQKWYRVSLRFFGDGLDLASVTSALGLKPDLTGRMGEHIQGNPRYAIYDTNVWVCRYAEDKKVAFNDQLSAFITRLETRGQAIRQLVARPGVSGDLSLGFSSGNGQGGFTLPALLLARIVDLGFDVALDLYPPTVDEA